MDGGNPVYIFTYVACSSFKTGSSAIEGTHRDDSIWGRDLAFVAGTSAILRFIDSWLFPLSKSNFYVNIVLKFLYFMQSQPIWETRIQYNTRFFCRDSFLFFADSTSNCSFKNN